jgi:hypothetical protein
LRRHPGVAALVVVTSFLLVGCPASSQDEPPVLAVHCDDTVRVGRIGNARASASGPVGKSFHWTQSSNDGGRVGFAPESGGTSPGSGEINSVQGAPVIVFGLARGTVELRAHSRVQAEGEVSRPISKACVVNVIGAPKASGAPSPSPLPKVSGCALLTAPDVEAARGGPVERLGGTAGLGHGTCAYGTPPGEVHVLVRIFGDAEQARAEFQARLARLDDPQPLGGLSAFADEAAGSAPRFLMLADRAVVVLDVETITRPGQPAPRPATEVAGDLLRAIGRRLP